MPPIRRIQPSDLLPLRRLWPHTRRQQPPYVLGQLNTSYLRSSPAPCSRSQLVFVLFFSAIIVRQKITLAPLGAATAPSSSARPIKSLCSLSSLPSISVLHPTPFLLYMIWNLRGDMILVEAVQVNN
nr:hypothetical protein Iba_chr03cCG4550 [Ipomoea batatas]